MDVDLTMKDYFNILGVPQSASPEEIKKAYRSLAMKHHPDRGGDQAAFQEIQEAYDVLSNPDRRQSWEQERQFAEMGGNRFHFNFGGGGPGGINLDEIFRQFHGDGFGQFRRPARNRDLQTVIELDLASTLEPQTKYISVQNINGSREMLTIEIPRGINTGNQIRFAGHGDKTIPNIPPGDLYIHFQILPHTDFQVQGLDLYRSYKLNCLEAIVGTTVNVTGLDQKQFSLNIPPGTQNLTKFRIPQQGLYDFNNPVRGNLIVVIDIQVPTNLDLNTTNMIKNIIKEQRSQ